VLDGRPIIYHGRGDRAEASVAHAIEGQGVIPHCEACAARALEGAGGGHAGILGRSRFLLTRWLNVLNGTPVLDISRGDMGSIRRLAEA
jgi:hypothetical protein